MRAKNISRFTYQKTAFQGWRLALRRDGATFVKYFGDSKYGGHRQSFRAAIEVRDAILAELEAGTASADIIFRAAKEWLDGAEDEE